MKREFTVVVEQDPSGMLIGSVPGLHGAHSQGEDLAELMANMREVIELCLEHLGQDSEMPPRNRRCTPHRWMSGTVAVRR